jgi:hypothetical protein
MSGGLPRHDRRHSLTIGPNFFSDSTLDRPCMAPEGGREGGRVGGREGGRERRREREKGAKPRKKEVSE